MLWAIGILAAVWCWTWCVTLVLHFLHMSCLLLLLLQGLRMLNAVGYGQPGSGLVLDLVYNPGGAFLAPSQAKLQPAYKQELAEVRRTTIENLCLASVRILLDLRASRFTTYFG
jgi:hypothetical protein